jgi:transketolase
MQVTDLPARAAHLRREILSMISTAGSGHPGSSLSAIDIMTCLYYRVMSFDPAHPDRDDRDRFVLSKGHAAPALYAILIDLGLLPAESRHSLRVLGSPLQGHPDRRFTVGVEASTGSLGQGLSMGVGMALGARWKSLASRIYVLVGDGECQEGQIWEAAMSAAHHGLDNLFVIVDANGLQHDAPIDSVVRLEPLVDKWSAFGWETRETDGHDFDALLAAFAPAHGGKPVAVIARTVKGKGVDFMENRCEWHSVKDPALLRERMKSWS